MSNWFRRGSSAEPANAAAANGKPLLLIGFNEASKQWEVGAEAMAALRAMPGPLCTVSVCGRARQGKSFLLNQMLGRFTGVDRPKGFVVSPTQQSCTRGIWMWSAPIQVPGPDGRKCNTLLMDCEGVDAVDQGAQHSAQIFSLAVLLSSIFVYNQVGAIDAIAIERLAMVCELAKRIKDRSAAPGVGGGRRGAAAAAGQTDFSPAFIWLLRDFQLRLQGVGGQAISPADYLEEALLPLKGGEADIANKNQLRTTIKAVFPDREAAVMVRPAMAEADLQVLDTLPYGKLRPEFRKDLEDFMTTVKHKARPMAVGGVLISGTLLAGLASSYVQAINNGAVPELVTAWQGVARAECQKAYTQAEAAFKQAFKVSSITEDQELLEVYQAARDAAMAAFAAAAMGEPDMVKEYEEKLTKHFDEAHAEARKKLAASGERLATEMLDKESAKLRAIMGGSDASVEAVEAELRRFLDEYDLKVHSGPFKYKKAAEFLMNTIIIGIKGIVTDALRARDAAAAKASAAEATVAKLRAELAGLTEVEGRAAQLQQQLLAAQQESARLSGAAGAKDRHAAQLAEQLAQLREAQAAAQSQQAAAAQELAASKAEAARLQGQLGAAGQLQEEASGLRQQLAALEKLAAKLEADKAAAEQAAAAKASQLTTARAAADKLRGEAAASAAELAALQGKVADLTRERDEAKATADSMQVDESRVMGELEEERAKVTNKMTEVAGLMADLAKERAAHDATRKQLEAARTSLKSPAASGAAPPSPAAAAAPAAGASSAAAAAAAGGSGGGRKLSAAGRASKRRRGADAAEDADVPAEHESAPAPAAAAGAAINTDIDLKSMTVADLKAWVTDNAQEDEEFLALSTNNKTKKADWVKFVAKKIAAAQS